MPGERSLYRKIQVVLEIAKSAQVKTVEELRALIRLRRPSIFYSRRYDQAKDTFVDDISDRVIARAVSVGETLGLLSEHGSLTSDGRDALRKTQYEKVISRLVRAFLARSGVDLRQLNSVVRQSLRADPPILPTGEELWTRSGTELSYSKFSMLLLLLVHSNEASCSQRKVFLHFNVQ